MKIWKLLMDGAVKFYDIELLQEKKNRECSALRCQPEEEKHWHLWHSL